MGAQDLTGENRCWSCTLANSAVGLLVGWLPLAVALTTGDRAVVAATVVWGVVVTGATGYRLLSRGYLPLAEPVARRTGLHDRIGPGSESNSDPDRRGGSSETGSEEPEATGR